MFENNFNKTIRFQNKLSIVFMILFLVSCTPWPAATVAFLKDNVQDDKAANLLFALGLFRITDANGVEETGNLGAKQWTRLLGGAGFSTSATGIASDSSGNVFATGITAGNLDGQIHSAGTLDLLITKYDSTGARQWTRTLGGSSGTAETTSNAIASDGSNVYSTGGAIGSLDGLTPAGSLDFFITKYDGAGVKQWTRLSGLASAITNGLGITSDALGNVYVTGITNGNLDGQVVTGTTDLCVVKYDSAGAKQWTRLLGVAGKSTTANGIVSDSNGNVYTTGFTNGNLDGQTLTGTVDLFVVKYDSTGAKQWTKLSGAAGAATVANGITSDRNGNIYTTGRTSGNMDGQSLIGTQDLFVVKYDGAGTKQWTKLLGALGQSANGTGIAADSFGNVYIAGFTTGSLDGLALTGIQDLFVVKYDSSGNKKWVRLTGEAGGTTNGNAIASDPLGNLYATGGTNRSLDGNPITGTVDLFIVKFH